MSDLIDRQAAIDALEDIYEKMRASDADAKVKVNAIGLAMRMNLESLPTIEERKTGRWIPYSERLPKYGKTVLITNDKGNVSYGRFRGVEFWKEDGDSYWTWKKNTIEHVLAWMPLPEPYKGEER